MVKRSHTRDCEQVKPTESPVPCLSPCSSRGHTISAFATVSAIRRAPSAAPPTRLAKPSASRGAPPSPSRSARTLVAPGTHTPSYSSARTRSAMCTLSMHSSPWTRVWYTASATLRAYGTRQIRAPVDGSTATGASLASTRPVRVPYCSKTPRSTSSSSKGLSTAARNHLFIAGSARRGGGGGGGGGGATAGARARRRRSRR